MTVIDNTRASHSAPAFFGHIGQSIVAAFAMLSTWNDARMTRNSLSKLSDRQLEDIGMCRGDIDVMVHHG